MESWKRLSCVNISCPELAKGETYTLNTGKAVSEITMTDLIYGEGSMTGKGGGKAPGGMGRHRSSPS